MRAGLTRGEYWTTLKDVYKAWLVPFPGSAPSWGETGSRGVIPGEAVREVLCRRDCNRTGHSNTTRRHGIGSSGQDPYLLRLREDLCFHRG